MAVMEENVFNKRTASSKKKTIQYLTQLYGFGGEDSAFRAFESYWDRAKDESKPMLAFLYAMSRDYLLQESVKFVKGVPFEEKATVEGFEENISKHHPGRFSPITLRSVAKNLASSWKQAGYIEGKIKNIRKENPPDYLATAFALLMAYLEGLRGEFLLGHVCVRALDVDREGLLGLVKSAADRDLLRYNHSGATMAITFKNDANAVEHV